MKQHVIKRDDAVSPVVGVMLMLVVTIIIAAVVSGFAGGLVGSTQKAPQASVSAVDFVIKDVRYTTGNINFGQGLRAPSQGADNPAADIYVMFEHMGGDSINLDQIEMHLGKLSEPQLSSVISRDLTPQAGPDMTHSQGASGTIGNKSLISGWSQGWSKYLEKYPNKGSVVINPGDRFVLHADYGTNNNQINWHRQGGDYPHVIGQGDVLTYQIIDKASRKIIATGQVPVPEFSVRTS